ncbi:MAG TPA: glycoside hydrolase family 2, partial [Chitinophagaceae bacterium]|nr:glycoside hydrolase family 2 [Chitinophagaceae bacterium]
MKKILFLVIIFSLLSGVSGLAQVKVGRHNNFDGNWKFHLGDISGAEQLKFDDSKWRILDLPHDWSIEGDFDEKAATTGRGGYLPTGIGWYRKTFDLPEQSSG